MSYNCKKYNDWYVGEYLNHTAFPLGGIGTGMICIEGGGALSHISLHHHPDIFNEPMIFSALCIKGGKEENVARVLEASIPQWKIYNSQYNGVQWGGRRTNYGLPRFTSAKFKANFPFAFVELEDPKVNLKVDVTGWSPFLPGDSDSSSLPVAALEYKFINQSGHPIEAIYSFHAENLMRTRSDGNEIIPQRNGFVLHQSGQEDVPWEGGSFCALIDDNSAAVDCAWYRGDIFDSLYILWNDIQSGKCISRPSFTEGASSSGASIYLPIKLEPGEEKIVRLMLSWYVPESNLRIEDTHAADVTCPGDSNSDNIKNLPAYKPWYAGRFADTGEVSEYWHDNYNSLREESLRFSKCFYDTTLPDEVIEAVAANLTILKSPTILRQMDGKIWCWEGCEDTEGCCYGSCTHVWNYNQAIPNLFPDLERTLRETEFNECQSDEGHQQFRVPLPIRPTHHDFFAASDGQLGGIIKVYREWRISGDTNWLKSIWPKVIESLDYCINEWDPDHKGAIIEPHHTTHDTELWGADGMVTIFYIYALKVAVLMGDAIGDDIELYSALLEKSRDYLETNLFNGEYFYQSIQYKNLHTELPQYPGYIKKKDISPEAIKLFREEGCFQYGTGCYSNLLVGAWMAELCGIDNLFDNDKLLSTLKSIYKYNFKRDLSDNINPFRGVLALNNEGGLVVCTWPKGGKPVLPVLHYGEVWTGLEYQVASQMILHGMIEEGLEIVRTCRDRYNGKVRNPFNEYECGHWYGRALSSYALIQAFTGVRYDAVDKILYIKPVIKGDFKSFLSTATGYGTIGITDGKPFVYVKHGCIEIEKIHYEPEYLQTNLSIGSI